MLNIISFIVYFFLIIYILITLKKNKDMLLTKDYSEIKGKWVAFTGLLSAITTILHAAPVFLPVIGLALSPLSSLPVIIGALLLGDKVLAMFLTTTALLFLISAKEAIIFLLATGPLGLAVSLVVIPTVPFWKKSLLSTSLLSCGTFLLIFFVGLPGLQNIVGAINIVILLGIILFSFLYSLLFMGLTLLIQKHICSIISARGGDMY